MEWLIFLAVVVDGFFYIKHKILTSPLPKNMQEEEWVVNRIPHSQDVNVSTPVPGSRWLLMSLQGYTSLASGIIPPRAHL